MKNTTLYSLQLLELIWITVLFSSSWAHKSCVSEIGLTRSIKNGGYVFHIQEVVYRRGDGGKHCFSLRMYRYCSSNSLY